MSYEILTSKRDWLWGHSVSWDELRGHLIKWDDLRRHFLTCDWLWKHMRWAMRRLTFVRWISRILTFRWHSVCWIRKNIFIFRTPITTNTENLEMNFMYSDQIDRGHSYWFVWSLIWSSQIILTSTSKTHRNMKFFYNKFIKFIYIC